MPKKNLPLYLILAGGLLARLLALWTIPAGYAAPDELPYFVSGLRLYYAHELDIFRPPFIGWVTFILAHFGVIHLNVARYFWVGLDGLNILLVWLMVRGLDRRTGSRLALAAAACYALYLPAIGYAVFLLTETPAVFFILATAWAATRDIAPRTKGLAAGMLVSLAVFCRPNLLPLGLTFPAFFIVNRGSDGRGRRDAITVCLAFGLTAVVVLGAYMFRNYAVEGRLTIANNSAYNLYLGNQEYYQEDLDLFHPRATEAQVRYRKEYLARGAVKSDLSYDEMQARGAQYIKDHPLLFARRALGRLARMLAPKTSVLEIFGGERKAGIFNARSMAWLLLANAQYAFVLFVGTAGLILLRKRDPYYFQLFLAVIAGALPLCLVAISKPRFSFPVEPVMIVAAVLLVSSLRGNWAELWADRRMRWTWVGLTIFYLWSWAAWLIFSFSSRLGIYE